MPTLYIAEYAAVAQFQNGDPVLMPVEEPLVEQTVAIGGVSAQSGTFNAKTRFVRLHTDAICSILFGTNPTATATKQRMAAGQTEFKAVPPSQSYKVAVITNT